MILRSLVGGFALSLLGSILFTLGQVTLFAVLYTLGVIVSLVGTGFLVGFKRQAKMAWDPVRRYAAAVFVLCIAMVFVFAFAVPIDILVIIFAILTFLSYACSSFTPLLFARAHSSSVQGIPWSVIAPSVVDVANSSHSFDSPSFRTQDRSRKSCHPSRPRRVLEFSTI